MPSLGVVCNVYNEYHALPGWLEMATSGYFDDVQVMHAGPGGKDSDDGTMDILRKWNIHPHRTAIDQGFGIVRTAAVRASKCDWVMLLDADERFYLKLPYLDCFGEDTPGDVESRVLAEYDRRDGADVHGGGVPSNFENIHLLGQHLRVEVGETFDQGQLLKDILREHTTLDAVSTVRRHWHDLTWTRPTQNWKGRPDYQARIVRNHPMIHWDANTRMHERLLGASNVYRTDWRAGPFFDHYHLWFKRMEPGQRAHDIRIYDALAFGTEVPKT